MANETTTLARYAATLRYAMLPVAVVRRAKDCLIDTVAAAVFGHEQPAGRIVVAQARTAGAGKSRILGAPDAVVRAESAALANGVLAHAFELDSLRKPGAGVHPGAVLV
ncbi:MAG: MmgE/PrpD family protein, partial [Proteobacteria bacterium]|nr:MmgE/PrpD family protein [Pseudomonadota bacterium]